MLLRRVIVLMVPFLAVGCGSNQGTLVVTSPATGSQCPGGGVQFRVGFDANGNGELEADELDASQSRFVCNGADSTVPGPVGPPGPEGPQGPPGTPAPPGVLRVPDADFAAVTPQADTNFAIAGTGSAGAFIVTGQDAGSSDERLFQAMEGGQPRVEIRQSGAFAAQGTFLPLSNLLPVEGAGTRLLWSPALGALRAGTSLGTRWDYPSIGEHSVAFGLDTEASGDFSTAFGHTSRATGRAAFAAGEESTASAAASVALGYHANTNSRTGSFVFSDRASVDTFTAQVNHTANWRVSGGFRIFTASNLSTGVTLQSGASVSNWGHTSAVISTSTGAMLTTGGVWQNASDVNRKHRFEEVSAEQVLTRLQSLPISRWSYRAEPEAVRHLGPTAQDFRAAFGLGLDELSIGTVDADGVALTAAKALADRTDQLRAENTRLRQSLDQLRTENEALEARLRRLEQRLPAQ